MMERLRFNLPGISGQLFSGADAHVSLNRAKVDSHNRSLGNLVGYDCPLCRNKGNVAILQEEGRRIAFMDCECMKVRRCLWKMEQSGLKNIIQDKTFDKFEVSSGWQRTIRDGSMSFAKNPQGWLLLCGQPGSGKTHLCTAVCRNLLFEGKQVVYMPWRDEIPRLKTLLQDSGALERKKDEFKIETL